MVDDIDTEDVWIYRRDPRDRRPVNTLDEPASNAQHRVLSPDVQLLYKSAGPRDKDDADFMAVVDNLSSAQRRWLWDSLTLVSPSHPWLAVLDPID